MKGGIAAAAIAAMVGGANAINHRHAHQLFAAKRGAEADKTCGCTTIWTTVTGEPTFVPNPPPTTTPHSAPEPELTTTSVHVPLPTNEPITCPTPGTYHFSATTITLTSPTTVCVPTTTHVSPGTHTLGGVTTIVETATTITCPIATTVTKGDTVHSTITDTVYVCPSAGTYTIGPITKTVTEECDVEYPVPTSYESGTYIVPETVITVTETGYVTVCPYTKYEPTTPASTTPAPTHTPSSIPAPPTPQPETSAHAPAPVPAPKPVEKLKPAPKPVPQESMPKPMVETVSKPEPVKPEPVESPESAPKSKPVEKPKPAPKPAQESKPMPAPTQESKPKAKPAPKKSSSGGKFDGTLGSNGGHYGITYTPYDGATGSCKDSSKVDEDIASIKGNGFNLIRVYSTDCDTLSSVGPACQKHGVRMIVGVFVKDGGCSYNNPDIKAQIDALAEWAQWDIVDLMVVGNEAIMNGRCTASELAELITVAKSKTGFSGTVSTAETLAVWQRSDVPSALCDVIDITGANIHPYFNPEVAPSEAGKFVKGQLELLDAICPGKTAINLECGWPKEGNSNGVAAPGPSEQSDALTSIRLEVGGRTVFFSYEDDQWKPPGSCGCERSWGCGSFFSSS